jgi:hypothetical protein
MILGVEPHLAASSLGLLDDREKVAIIRVSEQQHIFERYGYIFARW